MTARRVVKTLLAIPGACLMTAAVALATGAVTAERKLRKGRL